LAPENFDGWIDTERKISRPASGSTRLIRHHSKKHAFPDGDYITPIEMVANGVKALALNYRNNTLSASARARLSAGFQLK